MKRSRRERGGERRRGLFPEKQKLTKNNERLHHRGAGWSGFELPIKTATPATKTCVCACRARHDQSRVILSSNVFSSMAASLVGWLALWLGTALKTTVMIVTG